VSPESLGCGFRGQMILKAIPEGRACRDGWVKGDDPDKNLYPGPPGWGLAWG